MKKKIADKGVRVPPCNIEMIMENNDYTGSETRQKFKDVAGSVHGSDSSSIAPKNRRESGGHALFGSLPGVFRDDIEIVKDRPENAAYYERDCFGNARCNVHPKDLSHVIAFESEFNCDMLKCCAYILKLCSIKARNHLNTNADFKTASRVGRPDIMIHIMRILSSSGFGLLRKKNLLDYHSYSVLVGFLSIKQGNESLADYDRKFGEALTKLNSTGCCVSNNDDVQLFVNNLFGQTYLHGTNKYFRDIAKASEADKLSYPDVPLAVITELVKEWDRNLKERAAVYAKDNKEIKANRAVVVDDEDDDIQPISKVNRNAQKLVVKKAVTEAKAKQKIELEKVHGKALDHAAQLKAYVAKPYCAFHGYDTHDTHMCKLLSAELKEKALAVFEKRKKFLASKTSK